ncbi:hypothetical protein AYK24_00310 [Thermoplasmatales archaeon SG8-52-4]|nr:MAG: hypothetical protein AYK24_00310 [Thermoplasmatales archaeon SG8-52-4]
MITLENVTVDTLGLGNRRIQWEVVPTHEDLNLFLLDVYRAEAPGALSEFDLVVSGLSVLDGTYIDSGLQRMDYSTNRQIYYYLNVLDTGTAETSLEGPYVMESEPDYASNEILRRYGIFFDNPRYQVRTFYVLKKRTWGNQCSCIDDVTQEPRNENCTICYGTGIVGGYFNPIAVRGMRSDKPSRQMINLFGAWQDTNVFFKLENTVKVIPGDYIVDEHNERYLIEGPVNHLQKGIYTLMSNVRAKTVSKSDPIYRYGMIEELGGTEEEIIISGNEIAVFNGTSSYMEIIDNDLLSFLNGSFSITGWFELNNAPPGPSISETISQTVCDDEGLYEAESITLSNGNVFMAYSDYTNIYASYNIITQSGTEVTGPIVLENTMGSVFSVTQLTNNNIFICYASGPDSSKPAKYALVDESGTLLAGPIAVPGITYSNYFGCTKTNNGNIFVVYSDPDDGNKGKFIILDNSINLIFGPTTFHSNVTYYQRVSLLQNGNIFLSYSNQSDNRGEFVIYSQAGALIKSATIFETNPVYDLWSSILVGGNIIIVYGTTSDSSGKFTIYDENGNIIKTPTTFESGGASYYNSVAPTLDDRAVIVYQNPSSYYTSCVIVDSEGTITQSSFNINTNETYDSHITLLGNGNVMILYDVYDGVDTAILQVYDVIGQYQPLLVKDDKSLNHEWILVYDNSGNIHIRIIGSNNNFIGKYYNYPINGELHHYAITYNGNNSSDGINLYIDNNLVQSIPNNLGIYTPPINTSLNVFIGKWANSFFAGKARDIKIFNKALSSADINQEYALGNYRVGIVANYKLHEDTNDYGRYSLHGINTDIIFTQE